MHCSGDSCSFDQRKEPLSGMSHAGANSVPVDIFHSRATDATLRAMVTTAVAANMNMLRVWGGGMYYPDAFYDACDEMGVLVWQEAMFACSLYPADADFLDTVRLGCAVLHSQALAPAAKRAPVPWGGRSSAQGMRARPTRNGTCVVHSVLTVGRPLGCTGHEGKAYMQWHLRHAQCADRGEAARLHRA